MVKGLWHAGLEHGNSLLSVNVLVEYFLGVKTHWVSLLVSSMGTSFGVAADAVAKAAAAEGATEETAGIIPETEDNGSSKDGGSLGTHVVW